MAFTHKTIISQGLLHCRRLQLICL